jgi:hypothetical protein
MVFVEQFCRFFSIADESAQQQKWFCFYFMTGQHESRDIATAFSSFPTMTNFLFFFL